jgi:hypothetical protein
MMRASRGTIERLGQVLKNAAQSTSERLTEQAEKRPDDTQHLLHTLDSFFINARQAPSWNTVFQQAVMSMAFFDTDPQSDILAFRTISELDLKLKNLGADMDTQQGLSVEVDKTTAALYRMVGDLKKEVDTLREEIAPLLSAYEVYKLMG